MKSRHRTRIYVLALVGAVLTAALATAAFASSGSTTRKAADHKCPIATGSGDAAFVKNFNPFNVGASRDFTWGGIYENLIITTAFGGGNSYNVLAKSLAFTKDGKTLNITIVPNAKWSNGKPVTAQDVAYSLLIGNQDKAADHIGLDGREQQHQGRFGDRAAQRRDQVQGGRFDVRRLAARERADRPEGDLVEGEGHHELHQPEPGRLGAVQPDHAVQRTGLRPRQEPQLLHAGPPEGPVHRADRGRVERRRAPADRQR